MLTKRIRQGTEGPLYFASQLRGRGAGHASHTIERREVQEVFAHVIGQSEGDLQKRFRGGSEWRSPLHSQV
jgi:hypothetical protein